MDDIWRDEIWSDEDTFVINGMKFCLIRQNFNDARTTRDSVALIKNRGMIDRYKSLIRENEKGHIPAHTYCDRWLRIGGQGRRAWAGAGRGAYRECDRAEGPRAGSSGNCGRSVSGRA